MIIEGNSLEQIDQYIRFFLLSVLPYLTLKLSSSQPDGISEQYECSMGDDGLLLDMTIKPEHTLRNWFSMKRLEQYAATIFVLFLFLIYIVEYPTITKADVIVTCAACLLGIISGNRKAAEKITRINDRIYQASKQDRYYKEQKLHSESQKKIFTEEAYLEACDRIKKSISSGKLPGGDDIQLAKEGDEELVIGERK